MASPRWEHDDRLGIPAPGTGFAMERLSALMARLRADDGCPWDRSMDHRKLRPYLLEETYEVLKALDDNDTDELKKELGDLLLQVVFHCRLAEEEERFTFSDVANATVAKLLERHPHVFGDATANSAKEGLANWEASKQREGKKLFAGVPKELPALLRAYRVQEKAANVGFDWENPDDALAKLEEELIELHEAAKNHAQLVNATPVELAETKQKWEEELGDVLFSVVNVARKHGFNPEDALRVTIDKFERRFGYIEDTIRERGETLQQVGLTEMDRLWNEAKTFEKK
ncbi:MAG: nucleoside triphosphate pyrophosphohydrolase [bacterium]|nr:nucleoside triphosphate pyrophosphohydrolase [bacterium]